MKSALEKGAWVLSEDERARAHHDVDHGGAAHARDMGDEDE